MIRIRPFSPNDAHQLVKLANNKKISDNLRDAFPHPYTMVAALAFLDKAMSENPTQLFAIEADGEYVGNIGVHPGNDVYRKTAEIGYFIGEPYWNRGIATEAIRLITDYAFEHFDLNRIYAGVFSYNKASSRVLEKAGFAYEATHERAVYKNGQVYDELVYTILRPKAAN